MYGEAIPPPPYNVKKMAHSMRLTIQIPSPFKNPVTSLLRICCFPFEELPHSEFADGITSM